MSEGISLVLKGLIIIFTMFVLVVWYRYIEKGDEE